MLFAVSESGCNDDMNTYTTLWTTLGTGQSSSIAMPLPLPISMTEISPFPDYFAGMHSHVMQF